jgi:DNA-binding transcriptional ArsR family regulator
MGLEGSSLEEIKNRVEDLTREINQLAKALKDKRSDEIERVIVSNQLRLYAEHEGELLPHTLSRCLNSECTNNRSCSWVFRETLESVLKSVKTETINNTYNSIIEELQIIEKKLNKAKGTNCYDCYSNLEKELLLQWNYIERISGKKGEKKLRISFDIEGLVNRVLKPVSHPIRLKILVELSKAGAGFSDLSDKTGTKGGHLLFHLNQLLETGLVTQNKKKSSYLITTRGEEVLASLGNLM